MKRICQLTALGFLIGMLPIWLHFSVRLTAVDFNLRFVSMMLNLPGFLTVALFDGVDHFHSFWGHLIAALISLAVYAALWRFQKYRRAHKPQIPASNAITRRQFLGAGAAAGVSVLVYGYGVERHHLEHTIRTLPLKGLPPSLDGLRVALLADIHRSPLNSEDYLLKTFLAVNEHRPDLILFPGDFVSMSNRFFPSAAELVSHLKPRISGGLLGVLGNHDHWEGADAAREHLSQAGLHLIDNQRLFLNPSRELVEDATQGLCLAGVGDLWCDPTIDLEATLKGVHPDIPRLVMSHNPDVAEIFAAKAPRIDLMLSGHTHGGQVCLPRLGAPLVPSAFGQKYAQGMVQGPAFPVYVTRGVGVGGIPIRLGVRPEIAIFELKSV